MCRKETSVSHSSTESEIISLDTGLRMDGLLALDFWDVVIEVLRSSKSTESPTHGAAGNCSRDHKSKLPNKRETEMLSNCRMWTTSPQTQLLLSASVPVAHLWRYEAVVTWIIKGRSLTVRHVSRTHRVALDWFFDRINLDPKIRIKYVDTKKPTRRFHTWWMGSFVDWISRIFRCFLAVIFFHKASRVSCPTELRKLRLKKVRQWRNRDRWIWCQGISWARRKLLRKILRVIRIARRIKNWIRVMFHIASGNWRETSTKTQQCILKRGNKMTLNLPAPGNCGGVMNLQAQPAWGNWSKVRISNSKGQSYTSTACRSPIIGTLFCGKSWISQKTHQ